MANLFEAEVGELKLATRIGRMLAACAGLAGQLGLWWQREFMALLVQFRLGWLIDGNRKRLAIEVDDLASTVFCSVLTPSGRTVQTIALPKRGASGDTFSSILEGASTKLSSLPKGIVIPLDLVFQRLIEVPRALAARFPDIANDEMAQRTPFRPDRVFVQTGIDLHPTDPAKRLIRQNIVWRDFIEDKCRVIGIESKDIEFLTVREDRRTVETIEIDKMADRRSAVWPKVTACLLFTAAGLAFIDFGSTWWQQRSQLIDIESRIPAVQEKEIAVRGMLNEVTDRQAKVHAMFDRQAATDVLQIWEEMTRIIPDTGWLTEFTVGNGSISIAGYTDNATALIPLFAQSRLIDNVALSSPITLQGGGIERFAITARITKNRNGEAGRQ